MATGKWQRRTQEFFLRWFLGNLLSRSLAEFRWIGTLGCELAASLRESACTFWTSTVIAERGLTYFLDVTLCVSGRDIMYFWTWQYLFLDVPLFISGRDGVYFWTWHYVFLDVALSISGRAIVYFWTWRCVFLDVTFISSRDFLYFCTCHLFLDVTVCISGRDIYFFSWLSVFLHVSFISGRDGVYFWTWHLFLLVTFCISARVVYFWTWLCVFLHAPLDQKLPRDDMLFLASMMLYDHGISGHVFLISGHVFLISGHVGPHPFINGCLGFQGSVYPPPPEK